MGACSWCGALRLHDWYGPGETVSSTPRLIQKTFAYFALLHIRCRFDGCEWKVGRRGRVGVWCGMQSEVETWARLRGAVPREQGTYMTGMVPETNVDTACRWSYIACRLHARESIAKNLGIQCAVRQDPHRPSTRAPGCPNMPTGETG